MRSAERLSDVLEISRLLSTLPDPLHRKLFQRCVNTMLKALLAETWRARIFLFGVHAGRSVQPTFAVHDSILKDEHPYLVCLRTPRRSLTKRFTLFLSRKESPKAPVFRRSDENHTAYLTPDSRDRLTFEHFVEPKEETRMGLRARILFVPRRLEKPPP